MTATGTARCTCCGMRRKMSAACTPDGTPLGLCHDCAHRPRRRPWLLPRTGHAPPHRDHSPAGMGCPGTADPEDTALARLTAVLGYARTCWKWWRSVADRHKPDDKPKAVRMPGRPLARESRSGGR